MHLFKVVITCSSKLPKRSLLASPGITTATGISYAQPIVLGTGGRRVPVIYIGNCTEASSHLICISKDVQEELMLPVPLTLNLAADKNPDTWRLGPLIGIFANRSMRPGKPFGEQTGFFCKLRAAADTLNALCCVFGPNDIDFDKRLIRGFVPPLPGDQFSGWQDLTFPFPDAIYDRGLFTTSTGKKFASEIRRTLRNYSGLSFFNPGFFGKWKTHQLLSKHEALSLHLPETRLCTSVKTVCDLLDRWETVFIKPSSGSSGRGIIRVSRSGPEFIVNTREARRVVTRRFSSDPALGKYLSFQISGRRFIAQQGLNLAKYNGNPFDIRLLMQKNSRGEWKRTGMAARVSGNGCYISNIHAGGHAVRISTLLPEIFPGAGMAGKILASVRRLSDLTAAWISSEYHPLFGEIAIDLGIDESGRVWIIELNAVPGRTVFRSIGAADILAKAISRPMEYACFLAGFTPNLDKN